MTKNSIHLVSFLFLIITIITLTNPLSAQTINFNDTVNISEIVVTANRSSRYVEDVPGRVTIIDSKTINNIPVQNVDEILRTVANVNVNRSWGIFSQNASVTMRGLDGSARVLVLLDGVPLNKSAGGSINWNLVSIDNIDKIEVIKGPASAIYGNNAMTGVISIITKDPSKAIQGKVGLFGGSYGTFGGEFNLSGTNVKNNKGLIWSIDSYYRQGAGYILEPYETRDSINVKASLMEYHIAAKLGYQFNKNHKLEINFTTYDDHRGQGRKVYEELGDYVSVRTNYLRANYEGIINTTQLNILAFYQFENEFKQTESIGSNSGKYKLSDRDSHKYDGGLWINATTLISNKNILTYGVDIKRGSADVTNTYYTSTDILKYTGILDFIGFFIQDEIKTFNENLIFVIGARMDFSRYHKGQLIVENPTSNTGFIEPFDENFSSSNWSAFSPKLAAKYKFNKSHSVYISYSQGFMPPKIDDLSKSGKIRKGFKLANPKLGPEYITNYEFGTSLTFFDKLSLKPSVYLSLGKDFQYFVGTGDSIDTGGDALVPIYQRQNIAEVQVVGAEVSINYQINNNLNLATNYSINNSTIKDYKKPESYDKNLTGKYIIEVPKHMFYAGLTWRNKYFNTNLSYNYISSQWYDDENTILIDSYDILDFQVSKEFKKKFRISITIQNILDNEFVDRKGYLSPGRYIIAEVKYKF
jgi:outer membrane receptor protein involved in Fe transport